MSVEWSLNKPPAPDRVDFIISAAFVATIAIALFFMS